MADISTPASSKRIRVGDAVMLTVVLLAALYLLLAMARPQSYERGLIGTIFSKDEPMLLHQWNMTDRVTLTAFPPRGNIAASFSGMDPKHQMDGEFAQFFYYRTTYLMWPRRMFVADAQTPIRNGGELLSVKFPDDPAWMQSHDVQRIVRLQKEGGGLSAQPVWP